MNIENVKNAFEKRSLKNGLIYSLGNPVLESTIKHHEAKLGLVFPEQVRLFYKHYNGLKVSDPSIEILSIENLQIDPASMICFSVIADTHRLYFDISSFNDAGQWNIINLKNNYLVTLTFASYWSNKIWAWIDKKRPIWEQYGYEIEEDEKEERTK